VPDNIPAGAEALPESVLQDTAALFGLMSASVRLHLLWLLSIGEHDVGSLAEITGQSLATVSQKLGAADRDGLRTIIESLVVATKEMEKTNDALEARLKASKHEISQLQNNLEAVRNESLTDPLTTLANRKFFDLAMEKSIGDAVKTGEPLSLLMTDIDLTEATGLLASRYKSVES